MGADHAPLVAELTALLVRCERLNAWPLRTVVVVYNGVVIIANTIYVRDFTYNRGRQGPALFIKADRLFRLINVY